MTREVLFIVLLVCMVTASLAGNPGSEPQTGRQKMMAEIDAARKVAVDYMWQERDALGLVDPGSQLKEVRALPAHDAVSFHYQQLQGQLPIRNAILIVAIHDGKVRSTTNNLVGAMDVILEPKVSAPEAVKIARKQAGVVGPIEDPESHLILVPKHSLNQNDLFPDSDRLAWEIYVYASNDEEDVARSVLVDAHSGEVLLDLDEQRYARPRDKIALALFNGSYSMWHVPITGKVDGRSGNVTELDLEDPCYGSGLDLSLYTNTLGSLRVDQADQITT